MKKTAKRIGSVALAVLMLLSVVSLVACGGSEQAAYVFKAGAVTLQAGASAEAVAQLGTPLNYEESASCGGIPGTDKLYVFSGYRVKTTPGQNGDVIAMIELTDDSVSTPEGLTIGSTKDAVTSAMGAGTATGENLTYAGKGMKLQFIFRDGVVTNIQYVAD